ncbi:MAG: hypothetical protein JWO36_6919 [Myxococcales bacterium]|nr:hypothetical protein [Myxococcales bacterium]
MSRKLSWPFAIVLASSAPALAQPSDPPPDMTPIADPVPPTNVPAPSKLDPASVPVPAPSEPVTVEKHPDAPTPVAPPDLSDQAIGAELGLATGAHVTPGGLRVSGHYLYQLSSQDWFDGTASFTFGSGTAACFRDRSDSFVCDHGLADGAGVEIGATVRRFIGGKGQFWPFIRAGAGVGIVRFNNDSVTGLAIPLHGGGGVRVSVSPTVAITAQAELMVGVGLFSHGLGAESQFGLSVSAGAEFRL